MIKNFEELEAKQAQCAKCMEGKFKGESGKRSVVLCGGTGCLSSNSMEIKARFEKLIEENNLQDKVSCNIVGCFGFCSQGPFVKIYPEDTLYRLVQLEDVEEIIEKDIIGGEVVERLLYVDPATKEPRIWAISDGAREMLVYLRKLYSEKLIDQEMFTNGTNNAGALATTDSLGIVLHTTASMISNDKIGDYVGLKTALTGPDGTGYVVDARSNLHSVGNYCITTACENIELAVEWVDYFYSEEGARFMLVGEEGKDWEIKADGKGYWTDEGAARRTPDMSQDAFIALFSMWPGGRVPAAFFSGLWGGEYSDEPAATAQGMINYLTDNVWPIISWTEEENEVVSTTESDIKKYIENFFALVIAGETELNDKTWNDFVDNVNSMGADDLLDAYKSALERIYGDSAY